MNFDITFAITLGQGVATLLKPQFQITKVMDKNFCGDLKCMGIFT